MTIGRERCQHDLLARGTTILIEGHWSAGVRARCTVCNVSANIGKRGRPKLDAQNLPHPDATQFADGRYGCAGCGVYVDDKGRLRHGKDCELQFGAAGAAAEVKL